jgi:nucleoside-triphosphatase
VEKRIFILTGNPGIGKTTVLAKTVSDLRGRSIKVGGMFSREVKEETSRVGFEIVDIATAKVGWLANVNQKNGPHVGKYYVNLDDLENIGVLAIRNAVENCDIIAIDEIGPMELYSSKFKETAKTAIESTKPVIAIVHWKAKDALVTQTKTRKDAEIFTVTPENRDNLNTTLVESVVAFLKTN